MSTKPRTRSGLICNGPMTSLKRILDVFRRPASMPTQESCEDVDKALDLIAKGHAAQDAGRKSEAREHYEAAVATAPRLAKAHLNLGNIQLASGHTNRALASYKTAIACDPAFAPGHYGLGNAYWHMNHPDAALEAYLKAIEIDPMFVLPWIALGHIQRTQGRIREAIESFSQAVLVDAEHIEAHLMLAQIYHTTGDHENAIAHLSVVLSRQPENTSGHTLLAHLLGQDFRSGDALTHLRAAASIAPQDSEIQACLMFFLSHLDEINSETLFIEHVKSGKSIELPHKKHIHTPEQGNIDDGIIKIGFVSGDFYNHAVSRFFLPIIKGLSKENGMRFYAYYSSRQEDQATNELRAHFHCWRSIFGVSDEDAHSLIVNDGVNILIDLSGYTHANRLALFARKPAPIQVSWIGYPGTTGMSVIDYYITDRYFHPIDSFAAIFTEKLVHLPANSLFLPYDECPPINTLPASEGHPFTFASFNRPNKLNRNCVARWSKLLNATQNTRILVAGISHPTQQSIIGEWLEKDGIDPSRMTFRTRTSIDGYMRLHHEVDLCLDTFPYSGGTTTNHALWMGVPTLTMTGSTPASRQTACVLRHLNMPLFVAGDASEFVNLGKYWAENISELATIRANLRERIESSPIRHPEIICSSLAEALRRMWHRFRNSEPAAHIDLSEWKGTPPPP